ncbi:MAG: CotH kinase family protein [Bacteroidota bacterium]
MKKWKYFLTAILLTTVITFVCCFQETKVEQLRMEIPEASFMLLQAYRLMALEKGIITDEEKQYVDATIHYRNKAIPVDIRLKGDWLDHLEKKKWSFRVKVKKGNAISGLRTFSLQSPQRRHYLDEWFIHKWMRRENVPSLRYFFRNLKVNGESWGLYAIEEHFDKQLPESMNRREAPIVKFEEDSFWEIQLRRPKKSEFPHPVLPEFEAADIRPFKKDRTWNNPNLRNQFIAAQTLMDHFRYASAPASEIVDIDVTARFFAIMDVCQTYHAIRWHNVRFYFNPFTGLLEPIAFDNFTENKNFYWVKKHHLGDNRKDEIYPFRDQVAIFHLFKDQTFKDLYFSYLEKYSSEVYIRTMLSDFQQEMLFLSNLIDGEFHAYQFDGNSLFERAKSINNEIKNRLTTEFEYAILPVEDPYFGNPKKTLYKTMALRANTAVVNDTGRVVTLRNYHGTPIEVLGSAPSKELSFRELSPPVKLNVYDRRFDPPSTKVSIPADHRYLQYKAVSDNEIFIKKISRWPAPNRNRAPETTVSEDRNLFSIDKDTWTIKTGVHTLTTPIIIPQGKMVIVEAGASMDFIKSSYLISYAPMNVKGEVENKVIFTSSDGTGRGIHIINAPERTKISNAIFSGFTTLEGPKRFMTGSVTIYQSQAELIDCEFTNINAEDALNVFGANWFNLDGLRFSNTSGDAVDIDFGIGTISNISLENIGNDGIDVSSGHIKIVGAEGRKITDKAITIGEGGIVDLEQLTFTEQSTGIAVKDGSSVKGNTIKLTNGDFGLAAYFKKAEYDETPISFEIDDILIENTKQHHLVDSSITIKVNQETIKGSKKHDIDGLFYPNPIQNASN